MCPVNMLPMPADPATVASRIRSAREGSGLSQEKLAAVIGVTSKTIARWEAGDISPQVSSLQAIAEATGVTAADLLSEEAAA